jgi:hypothetical protein
MGEVCSSTRPSCPFYEILYGRLEGDEAHIAAGLERLRRVLDAG